MKIESLDLRELIKFCDIFQSVTRRFLANPFVGLLIQNQLVFKTSVSQQTISKAGINKNKHSFTAALVFKLFSSFGSFGLPSKVVALVYRLLN